ncbi:MAG: hypothetical protein V9H26_06265 [Verrucomicrobiota bacterium]
MPVKLPNENPVNKTVSAMLVAVPANQSGGMQVPKLKASMAKEALEFAPR